MAQLILNTGAFVGDPTADPIQTSLQKCNTNFTALFAGGGGGGGGGGVGVDIVSFGADPTGVASSVAAINAAIASLPASGGVIYVPAGDFLLDSAITDSPTGNIMFLGAGRGQARLHISHTGIGLSITPTAITTKVFFRDLSFYAENLSGQTAAAFSITMPTVSSWGYVTTEIAGCEFFGYPNSANGTAPYPQTFTRGFQLSGCWSTQIRDVSWFGPPESVGASGSCFIQLANCYDTRIEGAQGYYGLSFIIQTGYCEGIYLVNPVVVGAAWLYVQSAPSSWVGYVSTKTTLLGLWITHGELNTGLGHIQGVRMTLIFVSGCDISRNFGSSGVETLFSLTDASEMFVTGCNFNGGAGGADIAISLSSVVNSSRNVFIGNTFANMATALSIVGANGTVASTFTDNDTSQLSPTTAIIDGSGINSGNRIWVRGTSSANNASGIASARNFVFQGSDNSVVGMIQSINNAANYIYLQAVTATNPPILNFTGSDGTVNGTIQTKGGSLFISGAGNGTGANMFTFLNVAYAVNHLQSTPSATGNVVLLSFTGTDTIVNGAIQSKGGTIYLTANGDGTSGNITSFVNASGSVNYVSIYNATTGNTPSIKFVGTDATIYGAIQTKGGGFSIGAGGDGSSANMLQLINVASSLNYVTIQNAASGNLSVISTNAGGLSIQSGATIYLAPTTQLWLGSGSGTGAVYSATIAGVTTNPGGGVSNKIWNNNGVLALSGSTNGSPLFASTFLATQPFLDNAANSSIFSHNAGNVPTSPTTLSGATLGDLFRLNGHYNFGWIWAPSTNYDCWPQLQNYLLYAQLMFLAQAGSSFSNVAERQFVDVHLPAGKYYISQPLIIPEYVRFGGPGVLVPAPYVGAQSGGSLVNGIFYSNVSTGLPGNMMPLVVVCPRAHLSDLNINCRGGNGSSWFATSGVVFGKNWQPYGGVSLTIGNAGTGYAVGDQVTLAQPSLAPFSPTVCTVTAISGGGGTGPIAAAVVNSLIRGDFALPPAAVLYNGAADLQQQQWTAANGFSVFDPSNPGCFLTSNYGGGSGSGATLGIPGSAWVPDFTAGGNAYQTGAALTNGSQAGRIQITGSVPINYDVGGQYGPSFNVQWSGLEGEIDSIQGLGGRVGLWGYSGQDLRIGRMNFVDASTFAWLRYCGSIECPNCVCDTCGQLLVIDQSHGIIFRGRAFYEEGNIKNPLPPINVGVTADGGSNPQGTVAIGAGSTTAAPVTGCDIQFTLFNMGGLPASTISALGLTGVSASTQPALCTIQYAVANRIELHASNLSQYGATGGSPFPNPSLLPASALYQIGYSVDASNVLLGSLDTVPTIDGVTRPAQIVFNTAGHAVSNCTVRVKDTQNSTWVNDLGICQIIGSGAPTSGTTGAGFAAVGSTYLNTTNGTLYRNTGTLASPTWTTP